MLPQNNLSQASAAKAGQRIATSLPLTATSPDRQKFLASSRSQISQSMEGAVVHERLCTAANVDFKAVRGIFLDGRDSAPKLESFPCASLRLASSITTQMDSHLVEGDFSAKINTSSEISGIFRLSKSPLPHLHNSGGKEVDLVQSLERFPRESLRLTLMLQTGLSTTTLIGPRQFILR